MSINDFSNKIKGQLGIDTFTIMCLLIIVLVGLASFGLGRLSSKDFSCSQENILITKTIDNDNLSNNFLKKKRYVASKNGKMYYTLDCSGAKRISEKNSIWFANRVDAEKLGYEFSPSCK